MTEDETIIAFLDDELDSVTREAFTRTLAGEPRLRSRVEAHRRLKVRIAAETRDGSRDPIPDEWRRMILEAEPGARARLQWRPWAAMAACLTIGVLAGRFAGPRPEVTTPGQLVGTEIATALDQVSETYAGAAVQIGLTFRRSDGRYCRTFTSARRGLAGVACREDAGWRAETLTAWRPAQMSEYRQLGSDTPAPVLASVDQLIAGEPLDREAAARARSRGWRP